MQIAEMDHKAYLIIKTIAVLQASLFYIHPRKNHKEIKSKIEL